MSEAKPAGNLPACPECGRVCVECATRAEEIVDLMRERDEARARAKELSTQVVIARGTYRGVVEQRERAEKAEAGQLAMLDSLNKARECLEHCCNEPCQQINDGMDALSSILILKIAPSVERIQKIVKAAKARWGCCEYPPGYCDTCEDRMICEAGEEKEAE